MKFRDLRDHRDALAILRQRAITKLRWRSNDDTWRGGAAFYMCTWIGYVLVLIELQQPIEMSIPVRLRIGGVELNYESDVFL